MPDLAIVLPTLNERDNIAPLIARIEAALPDMAWEAIVVDDDSADGTADHARALSRADRRIRVIQRIGRRGLASAAIEGALSTAAPIVAVMDADHQHDPALLPAMLGILEGQRADIVVASRFCRGGDAGGLADAGRQRLTGLANRIARYWTGAQLSDPMSGYFLMRTEALRSLAPRLSGIGFKILLDIVMASRGSLAVAEVPQRFGQRRAGVSKLDRAVALDFLAALYERQLGWLVPTRFALFGTVGAAGVAVHFATLALVFRALGSGFAAGQAIATLTAMSFNFALNNLLTYRDRRLRGGATLTVGWLRFCAACSVGALANVALAGLLEARGVFWPLAALSGIAIGAVWNYALSSRFVWGRF